MTRSGQFVGIFLAATLGVASTTAPLPAQEPRHIVRGDGFEDFTMILSGGKMQPLTDYSGLRELDPKETAIVVLAKTTPLDEMRPFIRGLKAFIKDGGAVLIASDEEGVLADLGIRLHGIGSSWQGGYRGDASYPFIRATKLDHPVLKDLTRVVANLPTTVDLDGSSGYVVHATFDGEIIADDGGFKLGVNVGGVVHGGRNFALPPTKLPFAVGTPANQPGPGRLLVLGDHDMFKNDMMLRSDTDNALFAHNLVNWLKETGDGGPREYVLFVVDGHIVDKLDVGLASPFPFPPLNVLFNFFINAVEEEDFLSGLLSRWSREQIMKWILIAASVLLAPLILRKLWRARQTVESEAPIVEESIAEMLAELPLFTRRHRALLKSDNLYELARLAARHFFETHGLAASPNGPPPLTVQGGWWQRRRLHRQLAWLWDLAYGPMPTRVRTRSLSRVLDACRVLGDALSARKMRFEAARGPKAEGIP